MTIRYSEPVKMDSSASGALNLSNYALAVDSNTSGCSNTANLTSATIAQVGQDSVSITLSAGKVFCPYVSATQNVTYKVTVSNVVDLAATPNVIGQPNFLTFAGNEPIKVVAAVPLSTTTVRVYFNKPVKTGNDAAGTAGCTTSAECGYRYKFSPGLGNITSGVTGTGALANSVLLTTQSAQTGSAYLLIVANAIDGDNFDNGSNSVQDTGGTVVQATPFDRAGFQGLGIPIDDVSDGPYFSDPFSDGSTFSWVFKYANRIYLGTNDRNNAAFRFEADGANPVTVDFKFSAGSSCSTTTTFGYGATRTCGTNQGPNDERGVVGFTSQTAVVSAVSYEALFVGSIKDNVSHGYLTQDLDTRLDWRQFAFPSFTGGLNTKSASTIYVKDNLLWECMASDHGTQSPICVSFNLTAPSGVLTATGVSDLNLKAEGILGKNGTNPAGGGSDVVGIDSMIYVDSKLCFANNGGILCTNRPQDHDKMFCTGGGGCNSPVITNLTPSGATASTGFLTSATRVLPTAAQGGLEKIGAGQKGIPVLAVYGTNLYMVRNAAQGNADETARSTALRGELWKCPLPCTASGWTRIISGAESEIGTGNAISMFQSNGTGVVYISFDDMTSGLRIFRIASTDIPQSNGTTLSSAGWTQQSIAGLNTTAPVHTRVYSSASIHKAGKNYLYFSTGTGAGGTPFKVFRQIDTGSP